MMKFVAAGLAAFLLLLTGIAVNSDQGAQAGFPNCTDGLDDNGDTLIDALDPLCQVPSPTTPAPTTPAPTTPAATTPAATTPAATTAAATGTGTATPTPSRLPAAAPQTGGEPSGGSDTLLLTLILGAAATISVAGVLAGRYALERRS